MNGPDPIEAALQFHRSGQLAEAIRIYREILARQPDDPRALHLLGVAECQSGRPKIATELIGRAIAISPSFANYHNSLGLVLAAEGKSDEAVAEYRRAIGLDPASRDAHLNLGNALYQGGRFDDSAAAFGQALALKSNDAETCNSLGAALYQAGRFDDAIEALGKAVQLRPNFIDAYVTIGSALRQKLELDRAGDMYREAIQISPDSVEAHLGLALTLLTQGNFRQGWPEYEWRRRRPQIAAQLHGVHQPQWDGSPLTGQTVLLHAEQGFGDTIHFVRFAPLAAARGARVMLVCPKPLTRLLSNMPGIEKVIAAGDVPPAFDLHCPLLSLPLAFKTELASIPNDVPYIAADASLSAQWRSRLAQAGPPPRVGLVWSGSHRPSRNRYRSMSFEQFLPILTVPGLTFVSLQKDPPRNQPPPQGVNFLDFTAELNDFADTAALLDNLDLLITSDTAVAHLAGAMGKRVWLLLSYAPDWRWLLNRDDSPWYPTMRLFRQKSPGDWDEVIARVATAVTRL